MRDIGLSYGRTENEIDRVLEVFKANWLTEVQHWYASRRDLSNMVVHPSDRTSLSSACKRNLEIPLALKMGLDAKCEEIIEHKNVILEEVESIDMPSAGPVTCDGYCYVTVLGETIQIEVNGRQLALHRDLPVQQLFERYK